MKKIIILFILAFMATNIYTQTVDTDSTSDNSSNDPMEEFKRELLKLKTEINTMKNDIEVLKEKTEWFTFKVGGSIKTTYGVNLWARPIYKSRTKRNGDRDLISGFAHSENDRIVGYGLDTNHPITHGFDFENKLLIQMLLGNKVIASSSSTGDYGTEISVSLKIKSMGISEMKPEGSWYMVEGVDDQGNSVDVYFPRYERGSSNIIFGNFQVVLDEAKVKNVLGTGFFVNYKDVCEVQQYYGITGIADILKLNHEYFNNGFVYARNDTDRNTFASLYYSFDADDYDDYNPESQTAVAMNLWSNGMLKTDPTNSDYNQKPHGFSFGYEKSLSEGFDLFIEAGISSKDAFDPKYYEDENIDYGFFLKAEPRLHNDKFEFHPKLAASFAFQTETIEDKSWYWSTFAAGLGLPFTFKLPTGKNDNITLELNYNLNVHIEEPAFSNIISFIPSFTLLDKKINLSIPFIYSFKNPDLRGGFQRIGHGDVKWVDQLYEDHIIHLGCIAGFDSQKLFGNIFQYKITNSVYFAYLLQSNRFDDGKVFYETPERFFYEILKNEFILKELGPETINMFIEFGLGYENNARVVDSSTVFKYTYDRDRDTWIDNDKNGIMQWRRWGEAAVVGFKVGVIFDVIKNFSVGFSAESPKLSLNVPNPIGYQQSFGLFKLWTEIKF